MVLFLLLLTNTKSFQSSSLSLPRGTGNYSSCEGPTSLLLVLRQEPSILTA